MIAYEDNWIVIALTKGPASVIIVIQRGSECPRPVFVGLAEKRIKVRILVRLA